MRFRGPLSELVSNLGSFYTSSSAGFGIEQSCENIFPILDHGGGWVRLV